MPDNMVARHQTRIGSMLFRDSRLLLLGFYLASPGREKMNSLNIEDDRKRSFRHDRRQISLIRLTVSKQGSSSFPKNNPSFCRIGTLVT